MATASATITFSAAAAVGPSRSRNSIPRAKYINGGSTFSGVKAHNKVVSLGLPLSGDQSFARIASSLRSRGRKGGALTVTCSAAIDEIFKIAAIMPALVLVGVAVGFVLLRVEAAIEEE